MITVPGTLRFTVEKVWVDVDPGIVELARALIPRARRPRPQRYPPHITVIRNEWFYMPEDHADRIVNFTYDPSVICGDTYWWLRCWCLDLTSLRLQLGLRASSEWSRPPDGEDCFHITIGNTKP